MPETSVARPCSQSHWSVLWKPSCIDTFMISVFQYVVIPTRRSTAEAVQILISHALGDAGSPYLIGVVCIFAALYL